MKKIKRYLRLFRALFPSQLPQTKDGMNAFLSDILDLASFPDTLDNRQGLLTMILHLGPLVAYKAKIYFIITAMKSVSSSVAFDMIEDIRDAKKATQQPQPDKASYDRQGAC